MSVRARIAIYVTCNVTVTYQIPADVNERNITAKWVGHIESIHIDSIWKFDEMIYRSLIYVSLLRTNLCVYGHWTSLCLFFEFNSRSDRHAILFIDWLMVKMQMLGRKHEFQFIIFFLCYMTWTWVKLIKIKGMPIQWKLEWSFENLNANNRERKRECKIHMEWDELFH